MVNSNPTRPPPPAGPTGPPGIPFEKIKIDGILEMTEEMQKYPLLDFDKDGNAFRRNDLKYFILTGHILHYDLISRWIKDNLKPEDYFFWNYTNVGICFVKEEDAILFYLKFA